MIFGEQRVRGQLERIRERIDNWAQCRGYGPGGWPQDAAVHDVIFLYNCVADLEDEVLEMEERERRYNELLRSVNRHDRNQKGRPVSDWPAADIIRINKGTLSGRPVSNVVAAKSFNGLYVAVTGVSPIGLFSPTCQGDSIEDWEEMIPVPAEALAALRDKLSGAPLSFSQKKALLQVTGCFPPTEEDLQGRVARAVAEACRDVGALDGASFRVALFKAAGEASPVFGWGSYVKFAALAAARLEALGHSDPATEIRGAAHLIAHPKTLTEKQDKFIPRLGGALNHDSEEAVLKLGGTAFAYATDILRQEKK